MILVRLCLIAAVSTLALAQGQQPQRGPRALDLPDTLGANFAVADSSTAKGTTADWDFLEGMFHFRFQQRYADGTFGLPFTGHWKARKLNAVGTMIEDQWRTDNATRPLESGTWTYRVFHPQRELWTIQGVEPERGNWQPGLTWSDDANRYVIQHNGPTLMRIRYFNITPMSFSWRADRSADGGQTWIRDWWSMQAVRISR